MSKVRHNTALTVRSGLKGPMPLEYIYGEGRMKEWLQLPQEEYQNKNWLNRG